MAQNRSMAIKHQKAKEWAAKEAKERDGIKAVAHHYLGYDQIKKPMPYRGISPLVVAWFRDECAKQGWQ